MTVAAAAATPIQSALDSFGADAASIERLWWLFFWVSATAYVLVVIALLLALFRKRRQSAASPGELPAKRAVSVASGIVVVTLFGLIIASISVGRGLADVETPAVTIELTGHQWWWQVEYDHEDESKRFSTANELTIPVGVPVRVELRTADVIHSFWVPNLQGKRDLITGKEEAITLKAERPGTFRGQCTEFCGLQHAKMALWVTAVPRDEYERWAESQRQPSRIPSTAAERKGLETFLNAPCPLCHTIAGTQASGKVAPDLTHFASRRSIGAGTLPNRRGFLAGWIVDPQHVKPGNAMPPNVLQGAELNPLLDYLESLR